jgi:hypothetical protein
MNFFYLHYWLAALFFFTLQRFLGLLLYCLYASQNQNQTSFQTSAATNNHQETFLRLELSKQHLLATIFTIAFIHL